MLLLGLSKLDESTLNDPQKLLQDSFTIPNWVSGVLDLDEARISKASELAHSLFSETPNELRWLKVREIYRAVRQVWDFPEGFLDWWIEAHIAHDFQNEHKEQRDALGCRIIEDKNGRYHYLPYYQRLNSEFQEFQIFSEPRYEDRTLYTNYERKNHR